MTPSLIKTTHESISLNANTKANVEPNGGVSIDLGQWRIYGNRREDFENLISASQLALDIFDHPERIGGVVGPLTTQNRMEPK